MCVKLGPHRSQHPQSDNVHAATRENTFVSTACFLVGERELRPATMDDVNDEAQGQGAFYMKRLEKVNSLTWVFRGLFWRIIFLATGTNVRTLTLSR